MKRYHVWHSGNEGGWSATSGVGDRDDFEEAKFLGEATVIGMGATREEIFGWRQAGERSWSLAVQGRPFEIYIYDRKGNES
jgi:hypothetical protein